MTRPPYSEDDERELIARLLVEPSQLVGLDLSPDDMFVADYRRALRAMKKIAGEGRAIDLGTLRDEGVVLRDVIIGSVTPAHHAPVSEYAARIRRDAFRRRYINFLTGLAERAAQDNDTRGLLDALHEDVVTLTTDAEPSGALGRISLADWRQPPHAPLLGVLAPQGTTILYGDGGDGKGWVAAKLAATLDRRVAILDFEMQPQEWGYRLDKFGVGLDRVLYFSPPTTMDRWATPEAAGLLRSEGVEYLIIDSAMYASDSEDPYAPNGALAYGRARRRLNNLPALLLAHVTGNIDKVFGSVFWRNESRLIWRLNKDTLTRHRFMECRKANGYPQMEGKRLNVEFAEEQGILKLHPHGQPWGEGLPA